MYKYEEEKFNIPELKGISKKSIEEHLKLYAGYVKHANLISEKIKELKQDAEKNAYVLGEINRRFGFEFNGIRNHEVYFRSFEGGPKALSQEGTLAKALGQAWGSFDAWLTEFKAIALTRGVGWAMLYYDRNSKQLLNAWIDEQHLGQLQDCALILGLDMWEHSFVFDYQPSGKKQYVEDFFANLNWEIVENNYKKAL
ncbi:MAG: superoxide dismutase [Candidatus Taylorbacteria bacterium]|nr:superoxide dismutase [Candidatus Taylorbacteria bacterium]